MKTHADVRLACLMDGPHSQLRTSSGIRVPTKQEQSGELVPSKLWKLSTQQFAVSSFIAVFFFEAALFYTSAFSRCREMNGETFLKMKRSFSLFAEVKFIKGEHGECTACVSARFHSVGCLSHLTNLLTPTLSCGFVLCIYIREKCV